MNIHYQYTLLSISLLCCASILWCLRANLLHPVHAIWWGVVALLMLLSGIFPHVFDMLAHYLGVSYPPTLFLFVAVVVLLVRMLMADMERCKLLLQIRRLNQHQARLALRVHQLEVSGSAAKAVPVKAKSEQTAVLNDILAVTLPGESHHV